MTTKEFFEKEKESRKIVDLFYKSQGWKFDRSRACQTYDVIIEGIKVEEKFRYDDYGDFLIEIMQDVNTCNWGWYYKTEASRIFYVVKDKKIYSVDWNKFKDWLKKDYFKLRIHGRVSVQGYGLTVNIAIKWGDIPDCIYKTFELDIKQLTIGS